MRLEKLEKKWKLLYQLFSKNKEKMIQQKIEHLKLLIRTFSFIFSIVHEPIAMGLAFGGGCLYGWIRVKTGSIYPSIIAHAIWNGLITMIVIFA